MPTPTGKLQLQDYDAALIARGFDAFQQSERYQMINFGYRDVANAMPYSWEESYQDFAIAPGTFSIAVASASPLTPSSIETIVITTDPYRRVLIPETDDQRFKRKWLYQDLTATAIRGQTAKYYVWQSTIYLLPPPQLQTTYRVFFHQWLPDMVGITDVTALPQAFDEVILDAALVRCHRRAHELSLAADAQGRVNSAIDGMLQNDVWVMEELQERTLPDDQWW